MSSCTRTKHLLHQSAAANDQSGWLHTFGRPQRAIPHPLSWLDRALAECAHAVRGFYRYLFTHFKSRSREATLTAPTASLHSKLHLTPSRRHLQANIYRLPRKRLFRLLQGLLCPELRQLGSACILVVKMTTCSNRFWFTFRYWPTVAATAEQVSLSAFE